MANRVLTKEQVEQQQREEYKLLPGILNYHIRRVHLSVEIDESRAKDWKKYEDFQAAIPIKGQDLAYKGTYCAPHEMGRYNRKHT